jgi:phage terminase large subunit GpA-like protein
VGIDKPSAVQILGAPKKVELRRDGRPVKARRHLVWTVGVGRVKTELYGFLGLARADDGSCPPGFAHFPQHGTEYFQQLTAEEKITAKDDNGFPVEEWAIKAGRQNHMLDARVYARAALEHPACRAFVVDRAKATATGQPSHPPDTPAPISSPPREPSRRRPRPSLLDSMRGGGSSRGRWPR